MTEVIYHKNIYILLVDKNKKPNINEILIDSYNAISDPKIIAEFFNEYFVSIGPRLASEASKEFSDHELTNNNNQPDIQKNSTFYFSQISVENVALALRNVKANKSTGLYKIPAKILKLSSDIVAPSLTHIFNLSLETGTYVDDRKRARVIPICKAGDKRKCENYRLISILSAVGKVFEREVFNQVYRYLIENSLLSRFQSGFRPKHSTLSALIQMCDDWLQNMDNSNASQFDVSQFRSHNLMYHNLLYHNLMYHNLMYHNLMYHDLMYHNLMYHNSQFDVAQFNNRSRI